MTCSVVSDSVTPWTVARQVPLSMGFPRQEYWSVAILFSRGSSQPKNRTWVSGSWEYPPKQFIRQRVNVTLYPCLIFFQGPVEGGILVSVP